MTIAPEPAPHGSIEQPETLGGRPSRAAGAAAPSPLRIVHPHRDIDLVAAEEAAAAFLSALGMDLTAESTQETPRRMAVASRSGLRSTTETVAAPLRLASSSIIRPIVPAP